MFCSGWPDVISLGAPGNESMIIMKFVDIDSGTFI